MIEPLECRRLLAATYYVSATGSDQADGRTPETAWRTIDRANGRNWGPGDRLLFEGGQTFSAQGTAGANVVANASFDAGLDAWADTMGTAAGNASITTDRTGVGSALVLKGSGPAARAQDVTASLKAGQAYKMGAWTKVDAPGGAIRRVGITFSLGGQQVAQFYRGFRNTTWAETDWAFVAPPAFDQATLWVTRGAGDTSALYADDFVLQSLPNGIVFDDTDSGSTIDPVIVGSYGAGKATIAAGDGIGFWGGNVAGVRIMNLNFVGSWNSVEGTGGNVGVGVEYANTRSDNSKLEFVTVEKCDISGFQWAGIRVGGWAAKSGYRLALFTDSIVRGNGDVGITSRGEFDRDSTLYANEKVFVARCKVYSNSGIPDKGQNTGSGILLSDTFMGTAERCVAHHNGALNTSEAGGPIGIWAFDSSKITLHYSESYSNKTGSSRDGAGFDFDSGVTQSVMQNNYSHDNDGAGYLLGQFTGGRAWGRNIVRNNISQNDGRKNSYGGITLSGAPGPYNVVIEHNTVYMTPSGKGGSQAGIRLKHSGTGVSVRNNIFYVTGNVAAVDGDKAAAFTQFNGNVYYNPTGAMKFRWNGASYNSLEAWRTGGGREIDGASNPTGLVADPHLNAPGSGGTLGSGYKLTTLTQYALLSTSPLIDAAVTVTSNFKGYEPSTVDYFGRVPAGPRRDVGAAEFF
ncbi:MAG TPA: right-handed parallel beta-helix repeat-containing protein [Tepidisphaeraceae bacterium]|nr:right-handed parallel beta-helix repeat-containing protein [Tepidisphaeraceae bacterium]